MSGGGTHAIQLRVHGTVPPLENHPVKMLVKHPSNLRRPTPSPCNTGPYSGPAFLPLRLTSSINLPSLLSSIALPPSLELC